MANFIEKLLEEKSRGTESEVFYTQWLLAKDYIPKVHSVIVRVFPHYSLHDATHSETVLNCIVRILGEEALKSLGPVDLWLLLSSAYYHDVGMAVYADDIVATLNDEEFLSFVKECQEDSGQALHPYAKAFRIEKGKLHFRDVALDGSTFDAPQFLMAEFIRRRHAQRSGKSLAGDSSIHLAGDPIPNRIINLLRRICQSHAKSFSDVMSLPVCEAGLGLDDCHPRFVSCMLRLGDLLDLDNNRFSTVLLRTLPSIPRDSLLHHEKHLSIEHLRLDSRKIEVSARCKDYDVADITNRWLEMIGDEFRRQRNSWNDIVPSGFTGHLPMVGELKVDLDGYDTIDGNKRPSFEVDTSKAIEMLQGAGLYDKPAQCVRELLQNAVDASYLAIFQEKGSLSLDDFRKACQDKKIRISVNNKGVEGDHVIWHVSIEDFGLGMSREDLRFLTKTGSKNKEKRRMIESMPEHMRPSGTFGIGFQSVFLMTDRVVLSTRKTNAAEEITAELFNPAGPRRGAILLKTKPAQMHSGTIIEFVFYSDKNLDHWSVSSGDVYSSHAVYSFDFVSDKTLDLDTARVMDEVSSFASASWVPVEMTLDNEIVPFPSQEEDSFDYYSEKQGMQICFIEDRDEYWELYYRNQLVAKSKLRIPFLSVKANILGGNAKDILSLNRNELQYQAVSPLRMRIIQSIVEAIENNPEIVPVTSRPRASMFIHTNGIPKDYSYGDLENAWKDFEYKYLDFPDRKSFGHSFGEILEISERKPIVWIETSGKFGLEEKDDSVVIRVSHEDVFIFLLGQLKKTHPFVSNDGKRYVEDGRVVLYCQEKEPIADYEIWANSYLKLGYYGRSMMPCNSEFKNLRIDPSVRFLFSFDPTFPIDDYFQMICPYVRKTRPGYFRPDIEGLEWDDANGELYRMAFEHRADKSVTLEMIRNGYSLLRNQLESIIDRINKRMQEAKKG